MRPERAEPSDPGENESRPIIARPPVGLLDIRQVVREELRAPQAAPLPPPQALAEYDQLVPGAAERILAIAERTIAAKTDVDDRLANAEIKAAKTGPRILTGLTMLAFAAAAVFFALGNQTAGTAFTFFAVIMFVRPFLARPDRG